MQLRLARLVCLFDFRVETREIKTVPKYYIILTHCSYFRLTRMFSARGYQVPKQFQGCELKR